MSFQVTALEMIVWNGTFPVNVYRINRYRSLVRTRSTTLRQSTKGARTSTTTIPKAKISACLLVTHSPNKISGADHLAVCPLSDLRPVVYLPYAIEASPKSQTRALPEPSIRIFGFEKSTEYPDITLFDEYGTYALQIPMHHMTVVEVIETLSHIQ